MKLFCVIVAGLLLALSRDGYGFPFPRFSSNSQIPDNNADRKAVDDTNHQHQEPQSISDKITNMLKEVFPDKARIDSLCTNSVSNAIAQKMMENDFLLRKVISLKNELEDLKKDTHTSTTLSTSAYNELTELNTQLKSDNIVLKEKLSQLYDIINTYERLREENTQLKKKINEWDTWIQINMTANATNTTTSTINATERRILEETVLSLDKTIKKLREEKISMRRSLDVLPLICLLVNLLLLLILGGMHIFPECCCCWDHNMPIIQEITKYIQYIQLLYSTFLHKKGVMVINIERKLNTYRIYKLILCYQRDMQVWFDEMQVWFNEQMLFVTIAVVLIGRRAYTSLHQLIF